MQCWRNLISSKDYDRQKRLTSAYVDMGQFRSTRTFIITDILTWPAYCLGESSAIVLANFIFGAYTNREGGPSAGLGPDSRTPLYGYHLRKTAVYGHLSMIEKPVTIKRLGALGYFVGKALPGKSTDYRHGASCNYEQFKAPAQPWHLPVYKLQNGLLHNRCFNSRRSPRVTISPG